MFEDALEQRCTQSSRLGFDAVDLVLCGETTTRRIRIAPADRWRPWRRRGLEAVLAEADAGPEAAGAAKSNSRNQPAREPT